jgi:hypothetical protein
VFVTRNTAEVEGLGVRVLARSSRPGLNPAMALRPLRVMDCTALARSHPPTEVVGAAARRIARTWSTAFHQVNAFRRYCS